MPEPLPSILCNIRSSRIPSLYAIRATAAFLVVFWHMGYFWAPGGYGVTAFFVLSGFLITHLLISEAERNGDLSLRAFYMRRTLRIFPAFYAYALVDIVSHLLVRHPIQWASTIASLTYTKDYYQAIVRPPINAMGHTWSLAVEEQFYLLWPFLFQRFRKRQYLLMKSLAATIALVWAYRAALSINHVNPDYIYYAFDTRLDALAVGCLAALAVHNGFEFRILLKSRWLGWIMIPAIGALYFISTRPFLPFDFNSIVVDAALPVLCVLFMLHAIGYGQDPVYRFLNGPTAYRLGLISYSLYLYHPFAVHFAGPAWIRPVMQLAFSVGLASASYFVVERPFLRLKSRYAKTPAEREESKRQADGVSPRSA